VLAEIIRHLTQHGYWHERLITLKIYHDKVIGELAFFGNFGQSIRPRLVCHRCPAYIGTPFTCHLFNLVMIRRDDHTRRPNRLGYFIHMLKQRFSANKP
jgi:hypothetical protein